MKSNVLLLLCPVTVYHLSMLITFICHKLIVVFQYLPGVLDCRQKWSLNLEWSRTSHRTQIGGEIPILLICVKITFRLCASEKYSFYRWKQLLISRRIIVVAHVVSRF